MKRKIRMILGIPPFGLFDGEQIRVKFTDKKSNDLLSVSRGEGQAIQFVCESGDFSTNFYQAWNDGRFLQIAEDYNKGHFEMRYVPFGKRIVLVDD